MMTIRLRSEIGSAGLRAPLAAPFLAPDYKEKPKPIDLVAELGNDVSVLALIVLEADEVGIDVAHENSTPPLIMAQITHTA